jgi:hypothetical protein
MNPVGRWTVNQSASGSVWLINSRADPLFAAQFDTNSIHCYLHDAHFLADALNRLDEIETALADLGDAKKAVQAIERVTTASKDTARILTRWMRTEEVVYSLAAEAAARRAK